jgi:hypothetical protein
MIGTDGGSRTLNLPFLRRLPLPIGLRRRMVGVERIELSKTCSRNKRPTTRRHSVHLPRCGAQGSHLPPLPCHRSAVARLPAPQTSVDHLRIERSASSLSESSGSPSRRDPFVCVESREGIEPSLAVLQTAILAKRIGSHHSSLERIRGIEPLSSVWKANFQPLDTRVFLSDVGGVDRNRTGNLFDAIEALSSLSYDPVR